jgi:hypothetical protein
MKQLHYLLVALFLFPITAVAQEAHQGQVEYEKEKQEAFIMHYAYPPEAVENAILQKLENMGYKGKIEKGMFNKDKGFRVFKGAYITDISDHSMDYILKIEPKSRKDKDETTVYLIIQKDGRNAIKSFSELENHRAKTFLNDLLPDVQFSHLDLQIRDQEAAVAKSEKKLKSLQDDQKNLEDKIKKLEKDLVENEEQQMSTLKDIEKQREALEMLKGRRRV